MNNSITATSGQANRIMRRVLAEVLGLAQAGVTVPAVLFTVFFMVAILAQVQDLLPGHSLKQLMSLVPYFNLLFPGGNLYITGPDIINFYGKLTLGLYIVSIILRTGFKLKFRLAWSKKIILALGFPVVMCITSLILLGIQKNYGPGVIEIFMVFGLISTILNGLVLGMAYLIEATGS